MEDRRNIFSFEDCIALLGTGLLRSYSRRQSSQSQDKFAFIRTVCHPPGWNWGVEHCERNILQVRYPPRKFCRSYQSRQRTWGPCFWLNWLSQTYGTRFLCSFLKNTLWKQRKKKKDAEYRCRVFSELAFNAKHVQEQGATSLEGIA